MEKDARPLHGPAGGGEERERSEPRKMGRVSLSLSLFLFLEQRTPDMGVAPISFPFRPPLGQIHLTTLVPCTP